MSRAGLRLTNAGSVLVRRTLNKTSWFSRGDVRNVLRGSVVVNFNSTNFHKRKTYEIFLSSRIIYIDHVWNVQLSLIFEVDWGLCTLKFKRIEIFSRWLNKISSRCWFSTRNYFVNTSSYWKEQVFPMINFSCSNKYFYINDLVLQNLRTRPRFPGITGF